MPEGGNPCSKDMGAPGETSKTVSEIALRNLNGGVETEKIKSEKGYTVPDEDTGSLFCIKVKSGTLVAAQGECGALPQAHQAQEISTSSVATSTNP